MTDRPKPVDIDAIDEQYREAHGDPLSIPDQARRFAKDAFHSALKDAWPAIAKELRELRAKELGYENGDLAIECKHLRAENEKLRSEVERFKARTRKPRAKKCKTCDGSGETLSIGGLDLPGEIPCESCGGSGKES